MGLHFAKIAMRLTTASVLELIERIASPHVQNGSAIRSAVGSFVVSKEAETGFGHQWNILSIDERSTVLSKWQIVARRATIETIPVLGLW